MRVVCGVGTGRMAQVLVAACLLAVPDAAVAASPGAAGITAPVVLPPFDPNAPACTVPPRDKSLAFVQDNRRAFIEPGEDERGVGLKFVQGLQYRRDLDPHGDGVRLYDPHDNGAETVVLEQCAERPVIQIGLDQPLCGQIERIADRDEFRQGVSSSCGSAIPRSSQRSSVKALKAPDSPSTAVPPEGSLLHRTAISEMSANSSSVSAKTTPARSTWVRMTR